MKTILKHRMSPQDKFNDLTKGLVAIIILLAFLLLLIGCEEEPDPIPILVKSETRICYRCVTNVTTSSGSSNGQYFNTRCELTRKEANLIEMGGTMNVQGAADGGYVIIKTTCNQK